MRTGWKEEKCMLSSPGATDLCQGKKRLGLISCHENTSSSHAEKGHFITLGHTRFPPTVWMNTRFDKEILECFHEKQSCLLISISVAKHKH